MRALCPVKQRQGETPEKHFQASRFVLGKRSLAADRFHVYITKY